MSRATATFSDPDTRRISARTRRVSRGGLFFAVVLWLVLVAVAQAGRYHIYSCSDPQTGVALPVYDWTAGGNGPTSNTCATNPVTGGLKVAVVPQFPETKAEWTFSAPAGTGIVAATLYRSAVASYRARAYWTSPKDEYTPSNVFDSCQGSSVASPCSLGDTTGLACQPLSCYSPADVLAVPAANLPSPQLTLAMVCLEGGCGGSESLHGADLTLEQNLGPTASVGGGPLATQSILQGTEDVQLTASDPGSGVFQAIFEIDGKTISARTIDTNSGRCQRYETARDGTNVFLDPQPCPTSLTNVDVPFDTAQVRDGSHQLTVLVTDAAGNSVPVLDRMVAFNNSGEYIIQVHHQEQVARQEQELATRGACNASCDDHATLQDAHATLARRLIVRRYAKSSLTLTGRLLTHLGAPLGGAEIELRQQPSSAGGQSVLIATTTTDRNGDWRFGVQRGPSRTLIVGYRSRSKDPGYAAQLQYHERVLAPVTLSAPRRIRPARPFYFRGRLTGGYISPGGMLVSLEIYYGGRWREIALLHTGRRGGFSYRYTFAPVEPGTYYFRATVPASAVYPFASATSRSAPVRLLR